MKLPISVKPDLFLYFTHNLSFYRQRHFTIQFSSFLPYFPPSLLPFFLKYANSHMMSELVPEYIFKKKQVFHFYLS